MSNFKYGLTCPVTEEQAREIAPLLVAMGRAKNTDYTHQHTLLKVYPQKNGTTFNFLSDEKFFKFASGEDDGVNLTSYNKDLILALAAAREGEESHKGEFYKYILNSEGSFTEGKLYRLEKENIEDFCAFTDNRGQENGWGGMNSKKFVKATKEEILAHFSTQTNQESMKEKKIVGYKVPYDITFMNWKKGEVATLHDSFEVNGIKRDFEKASTYKVEGLRGVLPREVVETWEPVYEQEEFKVGDWVTVTRNSNKGVEGHGNVDNNGQMKVGYTFKIEEIDSSGTTLSRKWIRSKTAAICPTMVRKATPDEVAKAQTKTLILGDKRIAIVVGVNHIGAEGKSISIDYINLLLSWFNPEKTIHWEVSASKELKVGCCTFKKEELEQVRDTYYEINRK